MKKAYRYISAVTVACVLFASLDTVGYAAKTAPSYSQTIASYTDNCPINSNKTMQQQKMEEVAGILAKIKAEAQTTIDDERTATVASISNNDVSGQDDVSSQNDVASEYANLVIAKVNKYVNVRDLPSETDGKIVGKLYDKSVGTYLGEENGWYKIQSGSVTGYVKSDYCVTGKEAVELAPQVCTTFATVNTTTLRIRKEATTESSTLGLLPMGEDMVVLEQKDGFARVTVQEGDGYVSLEYVDLHTEFVQAESIEEEAARLAAEEKERRKAQQVAATQAAVASAQVANEAPAQTVQTIDPPVVSEDTANLGQQVADYALQFQGNPYVYGGTSLTNGADCSGFTQSVYAAFGVKINRTAKAQRSNGYVVNSLDEAIPGDLIFYSGHVAIYIGNGQIVHASSPETGIIISSATMKTIVTIRRIF